ncbi:minor tail protein [Gordonia phage Moosehead]|nr:minor tail protein [Gordonia phage Moosehead]
MPPLFDPGYAPGYAMPFTGRVEQFDIEIGKRFGTGAGSKVSWRPVGTYQEAAIDSTWGLEAGGMVFTLKASNPLNDLITDTGIQRKAYHVRARYNGLEFTGRIKKRFVRSERGVRSFQYECVDYKYWLTRVLFWVNPLFPPEIQVGLTGKQDIAFGPSDAVMKYFLAKNFTRLGRPVYCKLPIRWPAAWSQDNIANIFDLDALFDILLGGSANGGDVGSSGGAMGEHLGDVDLLGPISDRVAGLFDEIVAMQCRFSPGDEAFAQTVDLLEMGVTVDFWDGHGTSPQVFNTDTLSDLQSIIDVSDDHFLDLSQLLKPIVNGLWSYSMNRAGYVFDTQLKRDRRNVMWRTDGTQIDSWENAEEHGDATDAVVGGKSPSMVNELIEIGANLAIAAIIAVVATIPGLAGIGGLAVGVGDLFDDIFFAYQRFWDAELEDDIGEDDAFAEIFADNTAAWSVDSYSVGKKALKDHGGSNQLTINTIAYGPTGKGISFGADNGTARRFRTGDMMSFWDRGNIVEQYASKVTIADKPGERMIQQVTLGDDKRLKGPWDRLLGGIGRASAAINGLANST